MKRMDIGINNNKNMNRIYQYEYAMYKAVADLFLYVECKSMRIDCLKIFFGELPKKSAKENEREDSPAKAYGSGARSGKRKSQESLLAEAAVMVSRDVIGNITFPMMHACAAQVRTVPEKDGTHTFVFTDGVYGFSVHLDINDKGFPVGIRTSPA